MFRTRRGSFSRRSFTRFARAACSCSTRRTWRASGTAEPSSGVRRSFSRSDQYSSEPPWEGHHREYTAKELNWMLERAGYADVEVEFLDYNMLQFEELSAEHTECLAAIVEDPSQSDTLLASGRRPPA